LVHGHWCARDAVDLHKDDNSVGLISNVPRLLGAVCLKGHRIIAIAEPPPPRLFSLDQLSTVLGKKLVVDLSSRREGVFKYVPRGLLCRDVGEITTFVRSWSELPRESRRSAVGLPISSTNSELQSLSNLWADSESPVPARGLVFAQCAFRRPVTLGHGERGLLCTGKRRVCVSSQGSSRAIRVLKRSS
jgi:hypothetical protein